MRTSVALLAVCVLALLAFSAAVGSQEAKRHRRLHRGLSAMLNPAAKTAAHALKQQQQEGPFDKLAAKFAEVSTMTGEDVVEDPSEEEDEVLAPEVTKRGYVPW